MINFQLRSRWKLITFKLPNTYRWKQVLGKQIDLSVKDLNGNKIDLGKERICLEIADVQCDACVDQYVYHMPNIEETYGDHDLAFVKVYLNDEKEDILSFFREYNAARIEELRSEKQSGVQIK